MTLGSRKIKVIGDRRQGGTLPALERARLLTRRATAVVKQVRNPKVTDSFWAGARDAIGSETEGVKSMF